MQKREQLKALDEAYGTAWRRFKTALMGINMPVNEEILTERETALATIAADLSPGSKP